MSGGAATMTTKSQSARSGNAQSLENSKTIPKYNYTIAMS